MSNVQLDEQSEDLEVVANKDNNLAGTFDAESEGMDEGINKALQFHSNIVIRLQRIKIEDIITSNFKKVSRDKTLIGLTGVVGEWGVVTPIHVMKTEDGMYMLLDGLRRIFASLRNGQEEINAMVWDFKDKVEGKERANILALMINRSQRFKNKELWEQHQILKTINGATPNLIEYLLQLQPGDAMKMEDLMLSDFEYAEIKENFMNDTLTIDAAYKKLMNERKKENRLAKEDNMVLDGEDLPSSTEELLDSVSETQSLSVDAVKDLLDLTDTNLEGLTAEEMHDSLTDHVDEEEHVQDPKNRHPLDPKLRKAVLERDEFKCRCCGTGGQARLSNLAVHHVIEVVQGGPDTEENLITVCLNCHNLIHCVSWGKVNVNFKELPEDEQEIFKVIIKYANVIIEADKRLGKTKAQKQKEGGNPMRHPFPGEGLKENKQAFESAAKLHNS